jgi:DNA polymerase-1
MVPVTLDFETEAIQPRPHYPPKPVGVALLWPGLKPRYYAWGHPTGNNCTRAEAEAALHEVWDSGRPVLCHNAKFDLDVAQAHFGMSLPSWGRVHDTLYLLFLKDPYAKSLSLKPSADRYLDMPPEEQDAVKEWLVEHGVIGKAQGAGAFISQCDGKVVGKYAIGDVVRTRKLFDLLYPEMDEGMRRAYDRERQLMPILLDNERVGIRVDVDKLGDDLEAYEQALVFAEDDLRVRLKAPSLNLDADADVAAALDSVGAVTEWVLTPKSKKRSTSKKNLKVNDPELAQLLGYRNRLVNVLSQSMRPWLAQANAGRGYITTEWNQVRGEGGGARTGRLSCARFMNVTKAYEGFVTPAGLPDLPLVRRYLLPDKGGVWCHRDYSSQEFRVLAHFEDAGLLDAYKQDARTDYHALMQRKIKEAVGLDITRHTAKIINFGILYGMGVGKLSESLKVSVEEATVLRNAQRRAAPGVQDLDREIKRRGRAGEPVRTWGGRVYYCEPPSADGRSFEYRLLNYLVQGSAADATKEAIIRYDAARKAGRLLVTVHDEVNVSAPVGAAKEESEVLRAAMESLEFDVPMLTEPKSGPSWGELK